MADPVVPLDPTVLTEAATSPEEAANESESLKARPLPDLIALDRYVRALAAASRPTGGMRIRKLVPPGTV